MNFKNIPALDKRNTGTYGPCGYMPFFAVDSVTTDNHTGGCGLW